jgi:hypothetical protein
MKHIVASCLLLVSCGGPPVEPPGPPERDEASFFRGDATISRNLALYATRPEPWDRWHGPFATDLFRIEEAMYYRRYLPELQRPVPPQALALGDFSHPACDALKEEELSRCPLVDVEWTAAREIPEGVELETDDPRVRGDQLRWKLLCHREWARRHPAKVEQPCPLPDGELRVYVRAGLRTTSLGLVSREPGEVVKLRQNLLEQEGVAQARSERVPK